MLFRLLGEPYSFFSFLPLGVINGVKSSYKNKKKPKKRLGHRIVHGKAI